MQRLDTAMFRLVTNQVLLCYVGYCRQSYRLWKSLQGIGAYVHALNWYLFAVLSQIVKDKLRDYHLPKVSSGMQQQRQKLPQYLMSSLT
jgi:hypothetical protein